MYAKCPARRTLSCDHDLCTIACSARRHVNEPSQVYVLLGQVQRGEHSHRTNFNALVIVLHFRPEETFRYTTSNHQIKCVISGLPFNACSFSCAYCGGIVIIGQPVQLHARRDALHAASGALHCIYSAWLVGDNQIELRVFCVHALDYFAYKNRKA